MAMSDSGQEIYAEAAIFIDGIEEANFFLTPVEIILGESLLTPGLQTFIRVHSFSHLLPIRNYDLFKGKKIDIIIQRKALSKFGFNDTLKIRQVVYRLSERKMKDPNNEEFIIHACDPTLLEDAKSFVSKSWRCTPPHSVVEEVLRSCTGAKNLEIESCGPARDYVADNIHPFQVCAQQCNVALAAGNDPSFVHFMTFGPFSEQTNSSGIHNFKSLHNMVKQSPIGGTEGIFKYSEVPERFPHPNNILWHTFPCDFDLLSDILNGINTSGQNINSSMLWNPLKTMMSLFGNQTVGCGIGGGNMKDMPTNNGSEKDQYQCPDYSYLYLPKRQARIGLLDQDKIALRLSVPWNPDLHAGKVIEVVFGNKMDPSQQNYGTGKYLISALKHTVKRGGVATTTMDCVAETVGSGIQ
jgi:hypothetical protein